MAIPGEENLGIVFKRIDLKDNNTILQTLKMFHPLNFAQQLEMNMG